MGIMGIRPALNMYVGRVERYLWSGSVLYCDAHTLEVCIDNPETYAVSSPGTR